MKTYRHGHSFLNVSSTYVELFEQAKLTSFDAVAGLAELALHRSVPGRKTYRVEIVGGDGSVGAYVKHSWAGWVWAAVRRWLNPFWRDPAKNEWRRLQELAEAGIAAPQPMAFGQKRVAGGVRQSVLVMTEVVGAEQGDRFFERLCRQSSGREALRCKRQLIEQIGDFAKRFHAAGFYHRDFYLCHFWFGPMTGGGDRLWLLDHHRTGRDARRWRRRRWLVKDIGQLHYSASPLIFSRTDRVRFLRRYFGCGKLSGEHRRFLAAVRRKSRRIAKHEPRYDVPPAVHGELAR